MMNWRRFGLALFGFALGIGLDRLIIHLWAG